jgi:lipopolysaccharide export system protein LptA
LIKLILILFLVFSSSYSQERIFYSADKFQGSETPEGPIKEYFGNVKLIQGDVTITCDYAKLFEATNISNLSGNVKLTQKDLTMKTHKATYYGDKKFTKTDTELEIQDSKTYLKAKSGDYNSLTSVANFYQNVFIEDDSVIVNSNYLQYNKKTQESYAYNNVLIKGKFNSSYLLSDTLIYKPKDKYSISYGKPVLFQIDSLETDKGFEYDTLSISSDTMQAFRYIDNEHYLFSDSVEIIRKDVKARSNLATYFRTKNKFVLDKEPIIWYENSQLYGDSITIELQESKLKRIESVGNAFSISKEFEKFTQFLNQLAGHTIEMIFEEGKISRIITTLNAQSLYFSQNDAGAIDAHKHDCNKIEMFFENDEIDKINFLENVNAVAIPYQELKSGVKEFYLPRYKWSNNQPVEKNLHYKSNYFQL